MKQRHFALVATIAFSAIAAFPTVAQAAEAGSQRASQCRTDNDARILYGLPTTDCSALEKTASGVMGPVRSMDDKSGDRQVMNEQCRTDNDARIQYGLPTTDCRAH